MSTTLSILVVEDKDDTIPGTLKYLRSAGHSITCAANVADAEESLKNDAYDLIWLDFRLPLDRDNIGLSDYAGEEILRRLRNGVYGEENARVPFIVVTAQSRSIDPQVMEEAGGYLGTFKKLDHAKIVHAIEAFAVTKE